MSYSGTVYCSYCVEKGHNRRGCPEWKKYLADNPDGVYARRERQLAAHRKHRGRKCSYCTEKGHNRATCAVKKSDKELLTRVLIDKRSFIRSKMLESGFGVGALVSVPRGYWSTEQYTGLITEIDWNETDNWSAVHYCIMDVATGNIQWTTKGLITEAEFKDCDPSQHQESRVKVISPTEKEIIENNFPSSWLRGTSYDEERYFPKGQGRQYWLSSATS